MALVEYVTNDEPDDTMSFAWPVGIIMVVKRSG